MKCMIYTVIIKLKSELNRTQDVVVERRIFSAKVDHGHCPFDSLNLLNIECIKLSYHSIGSLELLSWKPFARRVTI